MKLIIKIEIVVLVLVLLAGAGLIMAAEGVFELFQEPVIYSREAPPIPTDGVEEVEALPQVAQKTPEEAAQDPRNITAPKYFAYDTREETYLMKLGDADEKLYPASITKLLTCHVLLRHMGPAETVEVGGALDLVAEDSSLADLKAGDKLTVENLIAGMLLPSGNDAAQVAAVAAGRVIAGDAELAPADAVKAFVEEMNREAQALGMTNSHFENPDGYHHDNHYTTMNDLVTLSKAVLNNPTIMAYTSATEVSVELPDRTLEWVNTNFLLDSEEGVYIPQTMGLKTGYTGSAGSCLMSVFFMEDRLVIVGVFGCEAYSEDRYHDTVSIFKSL